ncbi:bifunctional methylenetetrahydrofolate dehydrogenase/methenyltetrahydrofolate cyclohydrolase FolD [Heyndrickxia acidicola]|uniref:Bifunctional protein FolD n=1 Tax=Heyndrickxia acidicola TaxID=209389 RepID=A0ABU6ML13_9BACI|nr:bifunctional methylenetetrahydrofolate dehydrogenase/methenyltetrahydrofolate cyclohydrolase FolD [Heyndrickxia acidicola]MED1205179.1 bifunctional methylenetetrahydrofolate dehydrogenase/methenyltetrahydrofolate cyclohydrolase FolD [Heyndrickxia acidicola]
MKARRIDGKKIAADLRENIRKEVHELSEKALVPGLAVVLIGNDPASRTYVNNKQKACKEAGIHSVLIEYPSSISEDVLLDKIQELNSDNSIHGILVQLPLPEHIAESKVIEAIDPKKDVDGFHPINIGRMMTGQDAFLPCTPFGIMQMIRYEGIEVEGKHVVVIGRSNIVGKPVGQLFLNENATVTYCHSKTKELASYTREADILISAVGLAKFVKESFIKPGAVVIDVGMNRDENGKLCGDVDFEEAEKKAAYITPVPGGVGPMTITMLLYNTLISAKNS